MRKLLLIFILGGCSLTATFAQQDCQTAIPVCNDATFAGNSNGFNVQELNATNRGCLATNEHQTTWFGFSPQVTGTIQFTITPTAGAIDYDFAVWGPFPPGTGCPITTNPMRCSYAAQTGPTGLQTGAGDNSEGAAPAISPRFVESIIVTAGMVGQVFYLVVDNFTANATPFTLDWTLSPVNILDCTPPLPVQLVHFEAFAQNNVNDVYWTTSSEVNSSHFIIEKSPDAIHYTELGRHTAAGNSNEFIEYSIIDENPYPTTYYKITQVDMNGDSKTYGPTVVINDNAAGIFVNNVFPNPAQESFFVDIFTKDPTELEFQVYDSFGKQIYTEVATVNGQVKHEIQSSTWTSGIYIVKVINEGAGINETRRVVIN